MAFGAEFRCDHCSITSVLIVDRALVPLSTLQKQGEKVCTTCGRMALREARFCQEGHALIRRCVYPGCHREFGVDHQRCDFCGKLQFQLHEVYQGTVKRVFAIGAFVEIIPGIDGLLHISEIANHRVKNVHDELEEGARIRVKVIKIDGNGLPVLSCIGLGQP
jgi:polyribonucleotide nucleotidyltransferase